MSFALMSNFCRRSITVSTLTEIFIQTRDLKKERKPRGHLQGETLIGKELARRPPLKSSGKKESLIE